MESYFRLKQFNDNGPSHSVGPHKTSCFRNIMKMRPGLIVFGIRALDRYGNPNELAVVWSNRVDFHINLKRASF